MNKVLWKTAFEHWKSTVFFSKPQDNVFSENVSKTRTGEKNMNVRAPSHWPFKRSKQNRHLGILVGQSV